MIEDEETATVVQALRASNDEARQRKEDLENQASDFSENVYAAEDFAPEHSPVKQDATQPLKPRQREDWPDGARAMVSSKKREKKG